eukprot:6467712-Amphidinium_carterae.2
MGVCGTLSHSGLPHGGKAIQNTTVSRRRRVQVTAEKIQAIRSREHATPGCGQWNDPTKNDQFLRKRKHGSSKH